jgi:hypothetical protein
MFLFLVDVNVAQCIIMRDAIGQDVDNRSKEWMTGIDVDLMSGIGMLGSKMGNPGRDGRNIVGRNI